MAILRLLLAISAGSVLYVNDGVAGSLNEIAFGNVIYLHYLDSSAQAYSKALYFEHRGLSDEKDLQMVVTRAGLALDLGLDQLAQSILAKIAEQDLQQLDRSRLYFQLARDAYRQQDWARFEEELTRAEVGPRQLDSSQGLYLQAELARLQGHFEIADSFVGKLPREDILRHYSAFNLGVTAFAADDVAQAKQQLGALAEWRAQTHEQRLIAERSRIVLANMEIKQQQYDEARYWLTGITSTGQYGPAAFATLAHLLMKDHDYQRAARLWYYLVENSPWHPAAFDAHVSLPYALEQVRGSSHAYVNYDNAATMLHERSETLEQLLTQLDETDPGRLVRFLASPDKDTLPEIAELTGALGDGDWTNWLASEYSQRLVGTWHRVSEALLQLTGRQRDLEILLEVDGQQQLRVQNAADLLRDKQYRQKINDVELKLTYLNDQLFGLTGHGELDEALLTIATDEEAQTLGALQQVSKTAVRLGANDQTLSRISRLRGLVLYRIFEDLPVRVQHRRVRLEQMTRSIADARRRAQRIEMSASVLGQSESVGGKIATLSERTDQMMADSKIVLSRTGDALIAQVEKGIESELVGINQQLIYVQLAMARIGDRQLLEDAQWGGRP